MLRGLFRVHWPFTLLGLASAVLSVAIVGALAFDGRQLLGVPVWFKPLKFMVSTAIYALTFAWLLAAFPRRSRAVWWVAAVGAAAWTVELVLIRRCAGSRCWHPTRPHSRPSRGCSWPRRPGWSPSWSVPAARPPPPCRRLAGAGRVAS